MLDIETKIGFFSGNKDLVKPDKMEKMTANLLPSMENKLANNNPNKNIDMEPSVSPKNISIKTPKDYSDLSNINLVQMSIPARANQDNGSYWKISIPNPEMKGSNDNNIDHFTISAVADGHGKYGGYYSCYCIDYLDRYLHEQPLNWLYEDDLRAHLNDLFLMLDNDCRQSYKGMKGGTTLSLCVRREGRDIWIANVGDSDVILVDTKKRTCERLSGDHSPTCVEEFKRIMMTHPETIFEYDQLNRKRKKSSSKGITNTTETHVNNVQGENTFPIDEHLKEKPNIEVNMELQEHSHENHSSPKKFKKDSSHSSFSTNISPSLSPSPASSPSSDDSDNISFFSSSNSAPANSVSDSLTNYSNDMCLLKREEVSTTKGECINYKAKAPPISLEEVLVESKDRPSSPSPSQSFLSESIYLESQRSKHNDMLIQINGKSESTQASHIDCRNELNTNLNFRTIDYPSTESVSVKREHKSKTGVHSISNKMDLEIVDINKTNHGKSNISNTLSQKEHRNYSSHPRNQKRESNIPYDYIPIYERNESSSEWEQLPLPLNNMNVYYKNVRRELACYLGYRNIFRTSMSRSIGDEIYKKYIGCLAEPTISSFPDFLEDNKSSTFVPEKDLKSNNQKSSKIDSTKSLEIGLQRKFNINITNSTLDLPIPMTPNVSLNDLTQISTSLPRTGTETFPEHLSSTPLDDTERFTCNHVHKYLILASDGYWDSCEFDDMINFLEEQEVTIHGYSEIAQANIVETSNGKLTDSETLEERLQMKRKMLLRRLAEKHVESSYKYFGPVSDDAFIQILY